MVIYQSSHKVNTSYARSQECKHRFRLIYYLSAMTVRCFHRYDLPIYYSRYAECNTRNRRGSVRLKLVLVTFRCKQALIYSAPWSIYLRPRDPFRNDTGPRPSNIFEITHASLLNGRSPFYSLNWKYRAFVSCWYYALACGRWRTICRCVLGAGSSRLTPR